MSLALQITEPCIWKCFLNQSLFWNNNSNVPVWLKLDERLGDPEPWNLLGDFGQLLYLKVEIKIKKRKAKYGT